MAMSIVWLKGAPSAALAHRCPVMRATLTFAAGIRERTKTAKLMKSGLLRVLNAKEPPGGGSFTARYSKTRLELDDGTRQHEVEIVER